MQDRISRGIANALAVLMMVSTLLTGLTAFGIMAPVNAATDKTGIDEANHTIKLHYDDYLDIALTEDTSDDELTNIRAQRPTSNKVKVTYSEAEGYANSYSEKDAAVIVETSDGSNRIHAVGVGTAKAVINGETYVVTVTPAPISLFLMIGQSNMEGRNNGEDQSIACEDGTVYFSWGTGKYDTDGGAKALTKTNANEFIASTLAGSDKNSAIVTGEGTDPLVCYPIDTLTESGNGKMGLDSGLAYEWVKENPGEKVWLVNSAYGGTSINAWQKGESTYEYDKSVGIFKAAQAVLNEEIIAGHYTMSHMGYFWLQGESDTGMEARTYVQKFRAMHSNFMNDLTATFDGVEKEMEFGNIILNKNQSGDKTYRAPVAETNTGDSYYQTASAMAMSGPRVAQYYMATSKNSAFKKVNLVCNVGDKWYKDEAGNDHSGAYFSNRYGSEFNYPIQSGTMSLPTSIAQLIGSGTNGVHYLQPAYNELGIVAAENTVKILDGAIDNNVSVKFLTWDGVTTLDDNATRTVGKVASSSETENTLLVPIVDPVYMTKKVDLESSETVSETYYDWLLENGGTGEVTAKYNDEPLRIVNLKSPDIGEGTVSITLKAGDQGKFADNSTEQVINSYSAGDVYGDMGSYDPTPNDGAYEFVGWVNKERNGSFIDKDTQIAGDTILYARYRPKNNMHYRFDFTEGMDLNAYYYDEDGKTDNVARKLVMTTWSGTAPSAADMWGSDTENTNGKLVTAVANRKGALIFKDPNGTTDAPIVLPCSKDWDFEFKLDANFTSVPFVCSLDYKESQKLDYFFFAQPNNDNPDGSGNIFVSLGARRKVGSADSSLNFGASGDVRPINGTYTVRYSNRWDGKRSAISIYLNGTKIGDKVDGKGRVSIAGRDLTDAEVSEYGFTNMDINVAAVLDPIYTNANKTSKGYYLPNDNDGKRARIYYIDVNIGSSHTHVTSDEWIISETSHSHECTLCHEILGAENHTFKNDVCTECGYERVGADSFRLSNLTVQDGYLDKGFTPSNKTYTVYATLDSIELIPTSTYSITINGEPHESGTEYFVDNIKGTPQEIDIVVGEGDEQTTYKVNVVKLGYAENQNIPWDGQPHGIDEYLAIGEPGSTVLYGESKSDITSETSPTVQNIGDRKDIYYKVTSKINPEISVTGHAVLEVVKGNNEITNLKQDDWVYGNDPSVPTADSKYGTVAFSWSDNESGTFKAYDANAAAGTGYPVNVGKYYLKASVAGTENYEAAEDVIEEFEITPKEVGLGWSKTSLIYNGKNQLPTVIVTDDGEDNVEAVVECEEEAKNVGAYTAKVTGLKIGNEDATNYKLPTTVTHNFVINKADLTVTAEDKAVVEGAAKPTFGVTYAGFVGDPAETASVLSGTLDYDCDYTTESKPGTYDITPKGLTSDNYKIKFVKGTLTVGDEPTASGEIKAIEALTYNGSAQTLVEASDVANGTPMYRLGDDGTWSETAPKGTNAGDYTVYWYIDGSASYADYHSATDPAEVRATISPKTIGLGWSNTSMTYNGKPQKPSVMVTGEIGSDDVQAVVEGEETNVGAYTATVTGLKLGDAKATNYAIPAIATHNFAINKADLTITAKDKDIAYNADATNDGVEYEGLVNADKTEGVPKDGVLTGTLAYAYNSKANGKGTAYTKGAKGTYYIIPSGVTADNYNITFVAGELTIMSAGTASVTAPEAKTNLAYSGEAQDLITAGTATNGIIKYNVNGGKYSEAVPKGTKAGTYTVGWTFTPNDNYSVAEGTTTEGEIEVTIAKKDLIINWVDKEGSSATTMTYVYDGKDHVPFASLSGVVNGNDVTLEVTGAATAVGEHTAKAVLSGDDLDNYKLSSSSVKNKSFTITKATVPTEGEGALAVTITGWTYGETANTPSVSGNKDGANVTYEYKEKGADDNTYTSKVPSDAGHYTVKATVAATAGYNEASATTDFEITQETAQLSWEGTSLKWTGEAQAPTATVSNLVRGDDVQVTVTGAQTNASDAKYTATATALTGTDADNYKLPTEPTQTFTISKNDLTPTVKITGWTYGDTANSPSVEGNTGEGEETYTYKVKGADDSTYTNIAPTAAGSYTVKASIESTDGYKAAEATTDFSIEKRTVSLEWDKISFVYDGKEQCPTASVANPVSEDNPTVNVTGKAKNAGQHVAKAELSEGSQNNYKLPATVSQTFIISEKALTITAKDVTIAKGAEEPASYEVTYNGLIENDSVSVTPTCSYTKDSGAGTYDIVVKDATGTDVNNYSITYVNGKLTVGTGDALAQAKADAKADLESYKSASDYREEQQKELRNEINAGKIAIDEAEKADAVTTALAAAKAEIDNIKTDAQLTEAEAQAAATAISKAKEAANSEVNTVNADNYIADDEIGEDKKSSKTLVEEAKTAATTDIEKASSEAEVKTALATFKTAIENCVKAHEHTLVVTSYTAATSSADGKIEFKCTECGYTESDTILKPSSGGSSGGGGGGGSAAPSSEVTPAEAASKAITSLPAADKLTLDDADSVAAARKAYDALSADEKKSVSADTLKKLTDAEARMAALYAPVNKVVEEIDALPAPNAAKYTNIDAVYEAKTAFDALSDAEKAKVGKAYAYKLEDVIAAMVKTGAAGTFNKATVTAEDIAKAETLGAKSITLGKKVKKISAGALAESSAKTLIVKTKKLTKSRVKGSLTGSRITTVKVKIGKAKVNKKYVKKYKKIFTKKNAGRKVTVK